MLSALFYNGLFYIYKNNYFNQFSNITKIWIVQKATILSVIIDY